MQGEANLFLDSEIRVHTQAKFKQMMLAKFGDVLNSADVQEKLFKRKMEHTEMTDEYCPIMVEKKKKKNSC